MLICIHIINKALILVTMPQQEITEKSRKYKETHMKWSDRRFVPSDLSNLRCDREAETVTA